MPNIYLTDRTAGDIDQRVAKILADLGSPEPPLDLGQVRQLLKLDLHYYSSADSGIVQEVVHRLTIGTKQVLMNPTRILDAIKQKSLRALWVPERRRILVDETLHAHKKRWGEGHEIIHSLVPHHQALTLGDPDYTLAPACHEQLETEANYGAGRLLFLRDAFRDRLLASPVAFQSIPDLAGTFGNSLTATLWRVVETLDIPAVGLVGEHPWAKAEGGEPSVRHFLRSRRFASQFQNISDQDVFRKLAKVVRRRGNGPIGAQEVVLSDSANEDHVFFFECFASKHGTLTLGVYRHKRSLVVAPAPVHTRR